MTQQVSQSADHFHVSPTVKHNHCSSKATRSSTVAAHHEQEGNYHGHLVHGHLVHGGFITNRSTVQKGGTGRLLHLFG